MMTERQPFMDTIRRALGRDQGTAPPADLFTASPDPAQEAVLERVRTRTPDERRQLLQGLAEVAGPLHIDLYQEPSLASAGRTIARLILEKEPEWGPAKSVVRWDHPLINGLELEALPELKQVPIHRTAVDSPAAEDGVAAGQRRQLRSRTQASFIGITSADYCVAATATLAMRSRPGQARSTSLVPSIHVAVIREEQLLASLEELYTLLKWDPDERAQGLTNCLSLVSGPSKTGDIELIMVHGAHGPRELHLFVVAAESLGESA
ncbi:LutC/YkgG family protein [Desulfogranum mediterraneum]|uniref:LutC/YkgG family protein n=1 Tax=Desulfogranum mediterraneum TaxID=160661 RepID=UPI000556084B|nr:lactate utilization protein [Desulfogranum mediterraneum]